MTQQLLVYQAVWGMENLPQFDMEQGFAKSLEAVLAAGFDGVGVSLGRIAQSETVAEVMRANGRTWEALGFVSNRADLEKLVRRARELGAHHLTVQILERTGILSEALRIFEDLRAVADVAPLPVYFETHRGRLTNDMFLMQQILEAMPDLRLTADLSHYPVAHELMLPLGEADVKRIDRIIANSWAFHGRVSGSHQVQVSIENPRHSAWFEQFQQWWLSGFRSWSRRAPADGTLTFMTELGPPNYAIVDAKGSEIADRWAESRTLAALARDLWARAA